MTDGVIVEEVLAGVGDAGRFQVLLTATVFSMEAVIAWSMMTAAIVGSAPDWWCVDPTTLGHGNMTLDNTTYRACSLSLTSAGHVTNASDLRVKVNQTSPVVTSPQCVRFYSLEATTIVTQWDLVCERVYLKKAINSAQMVGVAVGAVVAGQLADYLGRRVVYHAAIGLHAVACLVTGFSVSWQMYAVLRVLVGLAMGGYVVLHFVYAIEFVRPTWRPWLSGLPSWPLGVVLLSLVAWALPHWRYIHFIAAGISLPFLAGWFFLPESLRWLAVKGKVKAAVRVVEWIARVNRRHVPLEASSHVEVLATNLRARGDHRRGADRVTALALFSHRRRVVCTLLMMFCWMAMSMCYYGISFGMAALHGNLYVNVIILALFDIPATLGAGWIASRFGRRWTSAGFCVLASLAVFAALVIRATVTSEDDAGVSVTAVVISSRLGIQAAWVCIQVMTAELYPTVIRSTALAAANLAARGGAVLAPFIVEMETDDDAVRCYVTMGVLMAASGLSALLLGETKDKTLQDTLDQTAQQLDIEDPTA